jgi:hypothetical protein
MDGREADANGSLCSTILAQFGSWGNDWAGIDGWVYFNSRAAQALRMAALSLNRSALGTFYRRMRGKDGDEIANAAAAHKLAQISS